MQIWNPIVKPNNNFLLNTIGMYLTVEQQDAPRWSQYLAKECSLLMINYYKSDIEFDFEEMVAEVEAARFDDESMADREYARIKDEY